MGQIMEEKKKEEDLTLEDSFEKLEELLAVKQAQFDRSGVR